MAIHTANAMAEINKAKQDDSDNEKKKKETHTDQSFS
jgi:hypothetical protein